MVPAAVVDETIAELVPRLETGDILIDGSNPYYVDDTISGEPGTHSAEDPLCGCMPKSRVESQRLGDSYGSDCFPEGC
jgi:hypothetical protein